MIDFYAMGSPNVVKIYIALEEMGLPYTVHPVDVFGEAQFDPEFLKLNPNAKVPTLIDGDLVIWDNRCLLHRAIANYAMATHRRVLNRTVVRGTVPY